MLGPRPLVALVVSALAVAACAPKPGRTPDGHYTGVADAWGTTLRWETPDRATHAWLSRRVPRALEDLTQPMDPDCMWRRGDPCRNARPDVTEILEGRAATATAETLGFFNVNRETEAGVVRDFAGISQGYVLEELADHAPGPWLGDFGGDIYVSGEFHPDGTLGISDPALERVTYATVKLDSGWMLASTDRNLGADARNPLAEGEDWTEDFQRVVLFADADFDPVRLDAWSTALIPGGRTLLEHLEKLEPYRDHWAWLMFDANGEVQCSANLECDLDTVPRRVITPF